LPISSRTRSSDTSGRKLAEHGVTVRARNRQRLSLDAGPDEAFYLVRRGVFFVKTATPLGRSQILSMLFPGDLIWPRALPSIQHAGLIAASAGAEVLRLRSAAVMPLADADPGIATFIADRMVDLAARMAERGIMIAGLTGERRVAALLADLGDRIGTPLGAGVAFDMPLTRADIADHLALNSDTVSRIFSRLRAGGVISTTGRHRLFCRDIDALRRWNALPALDEQDAVG
jgi:CRP-like cAMP-binding protein